jgi:molybdopterin-guanine dinucleotide biosynthesis protein A
MGVTPTLAILAGGSGRRLGGRAKGLLTREGTAFVVRLLALRPPGADALIVSSDPAYDPFGVRRVEDVIPGKGAPGGLVTALLAAPSEWVLAVACDMPYLTPEAVAPLIAAAGHSDVTCFARDGAPEPLCAVYRSALGGPWKERLPENPSLRALIASASVQMLTPGDPNMLDSINTPADWASVKS